MHETFACSFHPVLIFRVSSLFIKNFKRHRSRCFKQTIQFSRTNFIVQPKRLVDFGSTELTPRIDIQKKKEEQTTNKPTYVKDKHKGNPPPLALFQ